MHIENKYINKEMVLSKIKFEVSFGFGNLIFSPEIYEILKQKFHWCLISFLVLSSPSPVVLIGEIVIYYWSPAAILAEGSNSTELSRWTNTEHYKSSVSNARMAYMICKVTSQFWPIISSQSGWCTRGSWKQ